MQRDLMPLCTNLDDASPLAVELRTVRDKEEIERMHQSHGVDTDALSDLNTMVRFVERS